MLKPRETTEYKLQLNKEWKCDWTKLLKVLDFLAEQGAIDKETAADAKMILQNNPHERLDVLSTKLKHLTTIYQEIYSVSETLKVCTKQILGEANAVANTIQLYDKHEEAKDGSSEK